MAQVHTVHDGARWRNKLDGLQQGPAHEYQSDAVAAGRTIAAELGVMHCIHDIDGSIIEERPYRTSSEPSWAGSLRYTA